MVQVMTLWAQGLQDVSGPCWHRALVIAGVEGSATRGHGGHLREGFVCSESMNQLMKEKVGLSGARTRGGGKKALARLYVVDRGQKFSFFTEGSNRDCNKKNLS